MTNISYKDCRLPKEQIKDFLSDVGWTMEEFLSLPEELSSDYAKADAYIKERRIDRT